jgi:hypothetical protein
MVFKRNHYGRCRSTEDEVAKNLALQPAKSTAGISRDSCISARSFTISRGAKSSGGLSMVRRCGKIEIPQMTSGAKPQ